LDIEDLSKTIVDEFSFQNGRVTEYSTDVVFGHAPARLGNPPLVQINLFDFRGNLVEQFNGWHPLWTFVRDDLDLEHLIIDTEATGSIAFPFSSAYGVMRVVDVERVQEIFSVDLLVPIRNFCNDRLEDPDCGW
jgi:hypothetical protein